MKIGIVSDLHTEFWREREFQDIGDAVRERLSEADLVLLPGDIGVGGDSVAAARRLFPDKPVYLIAGNHEFYHFDYDETLADLQAKAGGSVRFLHKSVVELDAIRLIATTLWTDFDLYGTPDLSQILAREGMNDFRLVRYQGHRLTPADMLARHRDEWAWVMAMLDRPFDGYTILMTHHAPVSFAISDRFVNDTLSPCFASRLEEHLVRDDLPLVIWGHTHHCVDRTIGSTRFLSSQTGYPLWPATETGQYGMVIEVPDGREPPTDR
jgi:predicted phosphodiesterase